VGLKLRMRLTGLRWNRVWLPVYQAGRNSPNKALVFYFRLVCTAESPQSNERRAAGLQDYAQWRACISFGFIHGGGRKKRTTGPAP
jgi:hypothetical protein